MRPDELSDDYTGTIDVIAHAVSWMHEQQLQPKEGKIIQIPSKAPLFEKQDKAELPVWEQESEKYVYTSAMGKAVGNHQGAHYFTKGQRKGLAVGGTKEPLFVIETDVKENIIYTGEGNHHPGLYRKALKVVNDEVHWIREDLKLAAGEKMEVLARIRYRQPLEKAELIQTEEGLFVRFENPQSAIQEGQFVAWYLEDELVGSGVIS